jgi:hypothetical protein
MSQPAKSMWEAKPSDEEREAVLRSLARPYFVRECRSVLDPHLLKAGFRRSRSGPDLLEYRRGRCLLRFGFMPYVTDEQPRYALTVGIGGYRGWFRRPRVIGLWQLPNPNRGGKRWSWQFRGPEQLKRGLKQVLGLLEEYVRPLWEDEGRLQAVLDKEWPIYLEMANP